MKIQDKFKEVVIKSKEEEAVKTLNPEPISSTVEPGPVFGINVGQPTRPESLKVLDDVQANVKKDENGIQQTLPIPTLFGITCNLSISLLQRAQS